MGKIIPLRPSEREVSAAEAMVNIGDAFADFCKAIERTAEWEQQAQAEVIKNKGCRTAEEWDKYKVWTIILNERSSFKYDIANAPTIEAEPVRHGRWIYTEYETGHAELQCSECGEGVYNKTKFCPNCGADMRGAEK